MIQIKCTKNTIHDFISKIALNIQGKEQIINMQESVSISSGEIYVIVDKMFQIPIH